MARDVFGKKERVRRTYIIHSYIKIDYYHGRVCGVKDLPGGRDHTRRGVAGMDGGWRSPCFYLWWGGSSRIQRCESLVSLRRQNVACPKKLLRIY